MRSAVRCIWVWALAFGVIAGRATAQHAEDRAAADFGAASPASRDDELARLVRDYFRAERVADRARLAGQIAGAEGASIASVSEAIRQVQFWNAQPAGAQQFSIPCDRPYGREPYIIRVSVRVPADYDPNRAYPLIVALPDVGASAASCLEFVAGVVAVGDLATGPEGYLIAATCDYAGLWLSAPADAAGDGDAILGELRRRYHVDTDRVYVLGSGQGGTAAFVWAVLQPDALAAAMPLDGALALQLDAPAVEVFLPNLRNLSVMGAYVRGDSTVADPYTGAVAAWNEYIVRLAKERKLPLHLEAVEAPADGPLAPPPDLVADFLNDRRLHGVKEVELSFRYPRQGKSAWLRQTKFLGEPWTGQRLVVESAPTETAGAALQAVLREKLAYLGGRIEGQTVQVRTRRCEQVEVRLNGELLDLDQAVTIYVDGTRRFEGQVTPSIATLLACAWEDWDFQRLWPVRLAIDHKGRAIER